GSLLFRDQSYTEPAAWFHCAKEKTEPVNTALRSTSPVSFADIEVRREFATSKDGTKIPLNILYRKGMKRDGQNPTLLYGYGGYGISMSPNFDFVRRLWFDGVGIYDMLRVELAPNGAFNVTEFGTVKDPEQFKALYAYSPYHHVADGTKYPSILMTTGANDGRVAPYHSRKMTARLFAANKSKN